MSLSVWAWTGLISGAVGSEGMGGGGGNIIVGPFSLFVNLSFIVGKYFVNIPMYNMTTRAHRITFPKPPTLEKISEIPPAVNHITVLLH